MRAIAKPAHCLAAVFLTALLAGCSIGKGYIADSDSKCRVVAYDEGGSGTISSPFGGITITGPGSYHVIGEGCENVTFHQPEGPAQPQP